MYLYLIKRTDDVDYDEYDSFVVAAPSHQSAKKLLSDTYNSGIWPTWSNEVVSERIGVAYYKKPKIILGSFNAG